MLPWRSTRPTTKASGGGWRRTIRPNPNPNHNPHPNPNPDHQAALDAATRALREEHAAAMEETDRRTRRQAKAEELRLAELEAKLADP